MSIGCHKIINILKRKTDTLYQSMIELNMLPIRADPLGLNHLGAKVACGLVRLL